MRKRQIDSSEPSSLPADGGWLDLEALAVMEISSEDPAYPVEGAMLPGSDSGWRAGGPGAQTVRVLFDEPQRLRRIQIEFAEESRERTQEFVLRWSADGGRSFQEIVRQQWTFSPGGATREAEDYQVELDGVTALELHIEPDIGSGDAVASLERLRLA